MSGRGTAGGVVFQAEVGAFAAAFILGERPISRLGTGLPGNPTKVSFETPTAVDDVLVNTDVGEIYIQAKRTITLSEKEESELASVADQFVRQFRAGVIENGVRRDLDPVRDRLLLAVGYETGDRIAVHLKDVLDRHRTGAATALPQNLTTALSIFSKHVADAWLVQAGAAITDAESKALLRVCAVATVSDNTRQLAEEALRDAVETPGDETGAMDLLIAWGADASAKGTGGDTAAVRLALSAAVSFAAPPSYRADVGRLLEYSAATLRRLERFASFETPEGAVTIPRPVTAAVVAAAVTGSLAITGEPGAGKSGVIFETAGQLPQGSAIVLAVEASATSLDALRREIGLEHALVDVLANLPGARPGYLFLDALEAVRGGAAEATYRKLVEEVVSLAGWRVVASVRTFDLRLGREWQRLFRGSPPNAAYASASFPTVRHLHIGVLGAPEMLHVTSHSPSIATAISSGGSKLAALATNPFNLALLGDLSRGGVSAASLATVGTRGDLLARYWDERITGFGTPATVTLHSLVDLMVNARSVDLPITSVPLPAAAMVDELQRVGVLNEEQSRRLAFRHHVLFDYAVARLLLMPDRTNALTYLGRATGAGLLISPSVGYWVEDLKHALSPAEFWKYALALIGDDALDPIIRIEFTRLVVESVQEGDDLAPLLKALPRDDTAAGRPLQHIAGSLLTRAHNGQPIVVAPWAALVGSMTSPGDSQVGSMSALVGKLLESNPDANSVASLGKASRVLFDWMSHTDNRINWLARRVVPIVAQTFGTDPAASRARLEQLFESGRFSRVGYIEVPWLARETLSIAPHDPDLVVELYARVFRGGDFSRDQVTSMSGSWILPLSSNAAQDFGMSTHSLCRDFPALLQNHPRTALRALAVSLAGEREKDHAPSEAQPARAIELQGTQRAFEHDMSYIWAWDIDSDPHDDYAKLYQATVTWFASANDPSLYADIPDLLLRETPIALVWRTLFDLGRLKPRELGVSIRHAAGSALSLQSLETRQSAIDLMAAVYPLLNNAERELAEADWLLMDFGEHGEPEDRKRGVLATLFQAIGFAALATSAARDFLSSALATGEIYQNTKPRRFDVTWGRGREDDSDFADDPTRVLVQALKTARAALANDGREENWAAMTDATEALLSAYLSAGAFDEQIDDEASATLADGLGLSLIHGKMTDGARVPALATLIRLASHTHPELHEETETNFEKNASWGSPAPRVEVAGAISRLIGRTEFWPQVRQTYESLLNDSHPAVRTQAVRRLPALSLCSVEDMWELMEQFFARETNTTVLRFAVSKAGALGKEYSARLEPLVLALVSRMTTERSDDPVTSLVTRFAVRRNLPASKAMLAAWIVDFEAEETRLRHVLFDLRAGMLEGISNVSKPQEIRARTKATILELIAAVEPSVRSWPQSGREPTKKEIAALKVFNEIASQLYYAAGHDQLAEELQSEAAQTRFLDEYSEIISKLMTLGTPHSVHHLLELLQKLAPIEPARCFDLVSEAMLRTTGVARYEYESLGAKLFVELIGLYLADYRFVFDDPVRRSKLVDCVAVFVEAGWPEARRLFQSLPELLQ